jgi:hypothetical protein
MSSRERIVESQKTQSPTLSLVESGPVARTRPTPPGPGTTGVSSR